jgi:hypothetical protein
MKKYKFVTSVIFLLFLFKAGISQDRLSNIADVITKIKTIQKEYRVVERTFSDVVVAGDTDLITRNRYWDYTFSSSNRYHLTAFGSSQDFENIDLLIYRIDENDKLQLITRDGVYKNDVSVNFNPTKSGIYYIVIAGTLKDKVAAGYFNVIIDRE